MKRFLITLMGALMVVGGVYCLVTPVSTFLATGYVVGAIIFCEAIGNIVAWIDLRKYVEISGWYLANAIISLIFGIIIMLNLTMQFAVDVAIVYIIAVWIVMLGISRVSMAIQLKKFINKLPKVFDNKRWIGILVLGVLMIVFGILCMFKPIVLSSLLGVIVALFIISAGVSLITLGTYVVPINE